MNNNLKWSTETIYPRDEEYIAVVKVGRPKNPTPKSMTIGRIQPKEKLTIPSATQPSVCTVNLQSPNHCLNIVRELSSLKGSATTQLLHRITFVHRSKVYESQLTIIHHKVVRFPTKVNIADSRQQKPSHGILPRQHNPSNP